MKTYLTFWFRGSGMSPREVVERLEKVGFKPVKGNYDMVYEWGREATMDEIIKLGDTVQKALKGGNVFFKMETL